MKKILIIGQAPPAVKQGVPYDTTLLYVMLSWAGISKDIAQELFEFEAMTDKFPGFGTSGHSLPHKADMRRYFETILLNKIHRADKIIILGNVAKNALQDFGIERMGKPLYYIIHPSKRNYSKIMERREEIGTLLASLIK